MNDVCGFQQVGYFVAGMEAMVYSDIVCAEASINHFISLYLCSKIISIRVMCLSFLISLSKLV